MSKRFSETDKWKDKWFRKLKAAEKLLFMYLTDNCDLAGFTELDIELFSFHTSLTKEHVEKAIQGLNRLPIKGDFIWLPNFVSHQKNIPLNPLNNAHKSIISIIKSHPEFEEAQALLPEVDHLIKVSLTQKEAVWVRDGGICRYTGEKIDLLKNYELDHIVPKSKGGSDSYDNMATCLKSFNREKSDKLIGLIVENYSSSLAKRELMKHPLLLADFNKFFAREIVIYNGNLVDNTNVYLGAQLSPIGKGKGKGKGKVVINKDSLEFLNFQSAIKKYPGSKGGVETEFINYQKKHKDWKEVVVLIEPAIDKEVEHRKKVKSQVDAKMAGVHLAPWKNYSTWINNRCWEQEHGTLENTEAPVRM